MKIVDLTEEHKQLYFECLEDWSEEIKEAGDHKAWFLKEPNLPLLNLKKGDFRLPCCFPVNFISDRSSQVN